MEGWRLFEDCVLEDSFAGLCTTLRAPHVLASRVGWIEDHKATDAYLTALARVESETHDPETVGSLTGSEKYAMAGSQDDWQALIVRTGNDPKPFSVLSSNVVVHVVECLGDLTLRWAGISGISSLRDVPLGARLEAPHSLDLRVGDTVVIPAGLQAIQLDTAGNNATILRFNGAIENEIDLSFDEHTGSIRSVSFNNPASTSAYFFVSLAGELSKQAGVFDEADARALADMFVEAGEQAHVFTQWKMAQTLGRIAPDAGVKVLERLAETDCPNACALARNALVKLGAMR